MPDKATVLLITPGGRTAFGGIARMVDYSVRAWPEDSSFALRVVDSYGPGSKLLMPFYALRAFIVSACQMLAGKVQLLHVNLSERLSLWRKGAFVLLAGSLGIPVIIHLHGAEFEDYVMHRGTGRRRLATALLARARKLIVLGSYWRDFLVRELGVAQDKIVILHNAVPDMPRAQARNNAECSIVFLGVVGVRKGVPALLKALALPQMQNLPWKMVIAGNGEVAAYRQMAQDLGLDQRTRFTGWLGEDKARVVLEAADIFVLPSRREGLPMAILEALSYGCPVVATPVGSIPDAVINGETGLLVPIDDPGALSVALAKLVSDTACRAQLGTHARRLFEEKFAIGAYNKTLEGIYREVTG